MNALLIHPEASTQEDTCQQMTFVIFANKRLIFNKKLEIFNPGDWQF
jgi:hypothetical protein